MQNSTFYSYLIILFVVLMGGRTAKVDMQAQKRIKDSKFKGKILEYANLYGHQDRPKIKQWADRNMVDNYYSVTYTSYAYPTYRKSKQEWIDALVKAHQKNWRMVIVQFTDVQVGNNNEIISLIYKWPFMLNGRSTQIYFELEAVFDLTSGKWKKSEYKQYGSKNQLKMFDYVPPALNSSSGGYSSEPTYPMRSQPSSSSSSNDQYKRDRERQERSRKQQQQRNRRERQSRQAYQRQQRQAAEREARYQQQQRQFRQNMRRQEQAQADYRRQQQQQAQQRYREAQQRIINSRRY